MKKSSADEIINSIVRVTAHTDRDLLEVSLASTLYELLDVERVALYRVYYEYNQPECYLAIEVADNKARILDAGKMLSTVEIDAIAGLDECLQNKKHIVCEAPQDSCLYLYPIVDNLGNVSSIFCLTGKEICYRDNEKFISGYFKIYSNYLRLLEESEHDTLTGLLNRRTFERHLEQILTEWHREQDQPEGSSADQPSRRQGQTRKTNWLAEIDIDHFKRINDQYGHLYGDEVLLLLSNIMRESFRGYDRLFRFGGEEFVVILRATDQAGVDKALERFRCGIESYPFPQVGQVTVSIGYVEIANQAIPTEVLGHADNALYYAKEHGRNQTCQFEHLIAEGKIKAVQYGSESEVELFANDS